MEAREGQSKTVHVLRHTFRPNEPLRQHLASMQEKTDDSSEARFMLASTRAIAVDAFAFRFLQRDPAFNEARQTFYRHASGVALRSVAHKFTERGDFILRFIPENPQAFAALTDPIDTIPDIVERTSRGGEYFLDMRIDAQRLVGREALARAWSSLRESLKDENEGHLYAVHPDDITGPERTVPTAAPVASQYLLG